MMLLRRAALAATFATPIVLSACGHYSSAEPSRTSPEALVAPPSYAGTWAFDARRSDRPGQGRGIGGGMGGGMGRGMGGGIGGRRGGGRGGEGGGGGMPGRTDGQGGGGDMSPRPSRQIVIEQTDSTVSLGTGEGHALTLHLDGRAITVPGPREGTVMTVTAGWDRGRLEVRRVLGGRITTTELYERSKDGNRLTIHRRVSVGADDTNPPETRQVYDRVSG